MFSVVSVCSHLSASGRLAFDGNAFLLLHKLSLPSDNDKKIKREKMAAKQTSGTRNINNAKEVHQVACIFLFLLYKFDGLELISREFSYINVCNMKIEDQADFAVNSH